MEFLIPIVALISVFGPIFYAIKRRYDLRELTARSDPKLLAEVSEVSRELAVLREERRLLQERIENLESIVCSVDYEVNVRLASLSGQPALPAASSADPKATPDAAATALGPDK